MARRQQRDDLGTATRILDSAELLVQRRGFNGFSYANVAAELGITKATLHYHFAGKAQLGEALIERYANRFAAALEQIDAAGEDAAGRLGAYSGIYTEVIRAKRMCLCGMLAAEYDTLPTPMRAAVIRFFDYNENWLTAVLQQGRGDGTLRLDGSAREAARALIAGLEGAMLVARPYGEVGRYEASASRLLAGIASAPPLHPVAT
jgi:TetR/AcrR family transcriptional repressor of nem operon